MNPWGEVFEHDPIRDFRTCPICEIAVIITAEKLGIKVDDIYRLMDLIEREAGWSSPLS